jgi:formate dehydrogenase subunit gamma
MIMAEYVDRFNTADRVLHWTLAISFFILAFSGLGLYAHTFFGYFDFFGGPQQGIQAHKWAGIVFFVSSVLLFIRHAAETCRFDADDRRWFASFGGYLSREKKEIPQGKFNAGQKLFGLFSFFATIVMGVTGLIIWEPTAFARGLTQASLLVHGLFFTLFIMGVIVHVYLASIGNPGTLEGMLWGRVKKIWARKHASKWYEETVK